MCLTREMGLTWKVHTVFRRQHTVNMGCTDTEVDVHIWCALRLNGIPSTCSCSCCLKVGEYTRSIQWHCACQQVTTTIMQYVQDWTTCVNVLAATSSSYILNTSYTHSRLPYTGMTGSYMLLFFSITAMCWRCNAVLFVFPTTYNNTCVYNMQSWWAWWGWFIYPKTEQ